MKFSRCSVTVDPAPLPDLTDTPLHEGRISAGRLSPCSVHNSVHSSHVQFYGRLANRATPAL